MTFDTRMSKKFGGDKPLLPKPKPRKPKVPAEAEQVKKEMAAFFKELEHLVTQNKSCGVDSEQRDYPECIRVCIKLSGMLPKLRTLMYEPGERRNLQRKVIHDLVVQESLRHGWHKAEIVYRSYDPNGHMYRQAEQVLELQWNRKHPREMSPDEQACHDRFIEELCR